jgi:hypothetical protein
MQDKVRPNGPGNRPSEQRPPDTNKRRAEGALSESPEMPGPKVYRAALRPHQDDPLSAQALAALWKRFCRCRRGVLRDGWKWAWQDLVDDECRAVALWEQRRGKTLKIIEAGKAAKEAARVRKLSPAERMAEHRARVDAMMAAYDEQRAQADRVSAMMAQLNDPERVRARKAYDEKHKANNDPVLDAPARVQKS